MRTLHLISVPFPKVWHTEADTVAALDMTRSFALLEVLLGWTASLLQVEARAHNEL